MSMSSSGANAWEPWSSELARAVDDGDSTRVGAVLEELWRFPFHEQRAQERQRWDGLFALLLRLFDDRQPRVRDLAYHYARIVMGAELGPPFAAHTSEDRARQMEQRTVQLLPALAPLVRSGSLSLLRCTDDLVHLEGLGDVGPQEVVREWITALGADAGLARAARIAYLDGRAPLGQAGRSDIETLLADLDHDHVMARAYAARALGGRYVDADSDHTPSPRDLVAMLTAKEIERPGIAGPFFSNWYGDFSGDTFGERAGVPVEEWLCTILAQRKHPEPDTLPCSNGIDFFAHEIFGGRAGYVRRLLDMGHQELAVQAATEIDERVEDMEPILVELANGADAEICRQAAWHLASHYRLLHEVGARRGFVAARAIDGSVGSATLLINLSPGSEVAHAYSAALYPPPGETFSAAQATACLELVLPEALRGALVPFGMPGDGGKPGLFRLAKTSSARYAGGAIVQYRGPVEGTHWTWMRILWQGPPGAWHPENAA